MWWWGLSSLSPCTKVCTLCDGLCVGCNRTIDEIREWSKYSVDDRERVMKEIVDRTSTHNCPKCGKGAYCAMEAGKSASTCWCMTVEKDKNVLIDNAELCYCKQCLTNE